LTICFVSSIKRIGLLFFAIINAAKLLTADKQPALHQDEKFKTVEKYCLTCIFFLLSCFQQLKRAKCVRLANAIGRALPPIW